MKQMIKILLTVVLVAIAVLGDVDAVKPAVTEKILLKDCDIVNSCSSGIYYCPDSGYLTMSTSWTPASSNPSRCASEGNRISFDIVTSTGYQYKNITMNGPQYGSTTISFNCNSGQKYYQYVTNQKNTDWDCSVTLNW